jgi:hypothetical protein
MNEPNPLRALTDEQKEILLARLLIAWKKAPNQRLGQLLYNAMRPEHWDPLEPLMVGNMLSTVEDESLLFALESSVCSPPLKDPR